MKRRHSEVLVGGFALLGFILLVIITVNLKQMFFFAKTYELNVYFKKVRGLSVGAPVHVYGVAAGEVKRIEYVSGEYPVKVVLSLSKDKRIYRNAVVKVVTAGLIGETSIEIDAGTPDYPELKDGDEIKGAEMVDLYQALSLAPKIIEDISVTIQSVRNMVTEEQNQAAITQTLQHLSSLSARIDDLITTTSFDIKEIATSLREASEKMTALIEESRGAVIEMRDGFKETRESLTQGVNLLTNEVGRTGEKISSAATSVGQTSARINKLLQEHDAKIEQALTDLQVATQHLRSIVEQIESGKGTLGLLVEDPTVYYELRDAVKHLKDILSGIRPETPHETIQYETPQNVSPSEQHR
ncbi:MCE family protein [Candidatus Sumerlaeota bacterium]|nr:MCE family protein [Candidatus Sumerlaeota bacterium]